ncbi:hypothetical protein TVNIR_2106 [Thioalkalivibrio nitratireducens DSM 14787]|uniref:Phage transcriptional regulator, AlpA n=1 Tax=Thioalkalivibrio nitratireducens (strain DSM 14787 / UNIQEM 213 / ALEN2) TaxID=1255043 RepID=L0DZE9_THIND|nr:AlpA family phage regulatory protein [Thioalkalivibrio nitratireducens]AGA33766.1 hypothetical protein TVNIR_2106 [Thioalkalivibrio nitratireducens DSM 14787]
MTDHTAVPTTPSTAPTRLRLLRDVDVAARYGIARQSVWRWVRDGIIPPPVRISEKMTRWPADALDAHDRARGLL